VHVHRVSEVGEHLLGAAPARILLIGVARFAPNQFLVFVCHGTTADPFFSFMNMNMVKFRHRSTFLVGSIMQLRRLGGP
jgi:hypothetical protein